MKKLFLLLLMIGQIAFAQQSSKINNAQNVPQSIADPTVFAGAQPLPAGTWELYLKDDLRWEHTQINGLSTQIQTVGSTVFKPLSYTPSSSEVVNALGYTPYPNTNPNSYLSTETDPLFDTKFGVKTTSDLLEGSRLYFTNARARSAFNLTTTGNSGPATYDAINGTFNIPVYTVPARVFNNNVTRTLNSNFTISTTRDSDVSYSLALSVTNPLLAGTSTASAFLEYSTDGGTNWITVSQVANASSVAISVTVAITLPNTAILEGNIPANALVRVRTTTSGTASVTYVRGQEVLE